jgi:hypothetical protein
LVYLLVFHWYVNEMQGSKSKIPSKISSGSVAWRDLIPALKSWFWVLLSAIIGHKTFRAWWRRETCQLLGQETNQFPSAHIVTHMTDPSLLLLRFRVHYLVTPYAQQHNTRMYHKVDAHVKTLVSWSGYIHWKERLADLVMFPVIYSFSAVKSNTAGLTVTGWTGKVLRPWAV